MLIPSLTTAGMGLAPQRTSHASNHPPTTYAPQSTKIESDAAGAERGQAINSFISRALRIEDPFIKARTLTNMADLLWEHNEINARFLVRAASEELKSRSDDPPAVAAKKKWFMSVLIGRVGKRDWVTARHLAESAGYTDPTMYLRAARFVVGASPHRAVNIAALGLEGEGIKEVPNFLFELRSKDEAAATEFFTRTLTVAVARPALDGDTLMRLGTYVFNSPAVPPTESGYEMVEVGGLRVVNLTADRDGIPSEAVRAYLRAVLTVLARPPADLRQQQLYYILGQQLLPRVKLLLPSERDELAAAMDKLAAAVPAELTRPDTYRSLAAESYQFNLDASAKVLDLAPQGNARDAMLLGFAHSYFEAGRFADASALAGKAQNIDLREALIKAINFGRVAGLLGSDLSQVKREAESVAPGVHRGMLWLGAAQRLRGLGDREGAAHAIERALAQLRDSTDPRAPYLLVTAAYIYHDINRQAAAGLLAEAVQAFNRDGAGKATPVKWSVEIRSGDVVREFSLLISGVPTSLEETLQPLVAADFESTVGSVMSINNEQALGAVLTALTASTLRLSERAKPRPTA